MLLGTEQTISVTLYLHVAVSAIHSKPLSSREHLSIQGNLSQLLFYTLQSVACCLRLPTFYLDVQCKFLQIMTVWN